MGRSRLAGCSVITWNLGQARARDTLDCDHHLTTHLSSNVEPIQPTFFLPVLPFPTLRTRYTRIRKRAPAESTVQKTWTLLFSGDKQLKGRPGRFGWKLPELNLDDRTINPLGTNGLREPALQSTGSYLFALAPHHPHTHTQESRCPAEGDRRARAP